MINGKIAFIQGGSRGIGAAIARRLAADGADIVFTYANSADQAARVVADIEAAGGDPPGGGHPRPHRHPGQQRRRAGGWAPR